MSDTVNPKDPKGMTASELLLKAAADGGGDASVLTPMGELFNLVGVSITKSQEDVFIALADKIDAELARGFNEGCEMGERRVRTSIELDLAAAKDWPRLKTDETIREYIARCFIARPRFEDGEPVQFGDDCKGGVIESITVRSNGRWSLVNIAGELIECGSAEQEVRRPAPEALGADGLPIVAGETVYDIETGEEHVVKLPCAGTGKAFFEDGHYNDPAYLTHTPPDTQDRIEEDAGKAPCDYFGREAERCFGCHAHGHDTCAEAMILDLLRRQRELDARTGGE